MIDKALLTGAFEKMGPERVTEMLRAFGPEGQWDSYCKCALGFAAGFGHKTDNERWDAMRAARFEHSVPFLAACIGISEAEAFTIEHIHMCGAWSPATPENRFRAGEFVALANEWLENRPASVHAATRATAVGACRFGRG